MWARIFALKVYNAYSPFVATTSMSNGDSTTIVPSTLSMTLFGES
jgi:hypothetical protein